MGVADRCSEQQNQRRQPIPGYSPREQIVGNGRRGAEIKVAAGAYFVEVMEAKRQAHHEDGEGAVVPPSVASWSCKEEEIKPLRCLTFVSGRLGYKHKLFCETLRVFVKNKMRVHN